MRRILIGLLPLAMATAALFAAAPAANAAVGLPATSCPTYGPGACTANITVTVTYNNGIITLHVSAGLFKPGEQVNFSTTLPSRAVGALHANSSGDVSGAIVLPAGYSAGKHGLDALGTISGITGSTSFTLTQASGTLKPCAAAHLSAACMTAAAPAGLLSSGAGMPGSAAVAPAAVAASHNASQLPFTGFNAATAAASGAILIGAGGTLVLMARRRRQAAWK